MKKAPLLLLLLSLLGQNLAGQSPERTLEDLVGQVTAGALRRGERPLEIQFRNPQLGLVPAEPFLGELLKNIEDTLEPSVGVESLQLYPKAPGAPHMLGPLEMNALLNSILALSTLEGIQYYSVSRGQMRVFYESSQVIEGPQSRRPIPDPVYSEPPESLRVYANQRDLSFGENIYQYDFYVRPGLIVFTQQNVSALSYGIIPAVGRNRLCSVVAIFDAGEYLLVYGASLARAALVPGMRERIGNSFSSRAEAIFQWFCSRADLALGDF